MTEFWQAQQKRSQIKGTDSFRTKRVKENASLMQALRVSQYAVLKSLKIPVAALPFGSDVATIKAYAGRN